MKKKFNDITNLTIAVNCLVLILGCILVLYPDFSLKTLGIIAAIYLIAHGAILLGLEMGLSRIYVPFENIVSGVLMVALGVILLVNPGAAAVLLTMAFGVWIIMTSINNIKVASFFRKVDEFPSTMMIVIGVLDIILGFLVILNPFAGAITLTLYLGIILIVHAIFNIVDMIVLRKNVKDNVKVFKEEVNKILEESKKAESK